MMTKINTPNKSETGKMSCFYQKGEPVYLPTDYVGIPRPSLCSIVFMFLHSKVDIHDLSSFLMTELSMQSIFILILGMSQSTSLSTLTKILTDVAETAYFVTHL